MGQGTRAQRHGDQVPTRRGPAGLISRCVASPTGPGRPRPLQSAASSRLLQCSGCSSAQAAPVLMSLALPVQSAGAGVVQQREPVPHGEPRHPGGASVWLIRIVDRVCHTVPQSGHRLPACLADAQQPRPQSSNDSGTPWRGVVPYSDSDVCLSVSVVLSLSLSIVVVKVAASLPPRKTCCNLCCGILHAGRLLHRCQRIFSNAVLTCTALAASYGSPNARPRATSTVLERSLSWHNHLSLRRHRLRRRRVQPRRLRRRQGRGWGLRAQPCERTGARRVRKATPQPRSGR